MHVIESRSAEELAQYAAGSFAPAMAATGASFRCRTELVDLGAGVAAGTFKTRPLDIKASRLDIARAELDDSLMFCIHLSGGGSLQQRGRTAEMAPGTAVLYESHTPWELTFPVTDESITLQLPRDLLSLRSQQITDAVARPIHVASPALQLLRQYLGQLPNLADGFTSDQRRDAARAAADLLVMAVRGLAPAFDADDVLVEVLREYVRTHLAGRELTVAELARRHHISVRQVHAVFARAGATPADFIRQERLLAARRMLADPAAAHRTVASVATAVGFIELRTFERAFRREYGMTAAQWRQDLVVGSTGT